LLVKTNEQAPIPETKQPVFQKSDIMNMSDQEFEKYEKDILIAQREGRLR
jgi:hypothetical protein